MHFHVIAPAAGLADSAQRIGSEFGQGAYAHDKGGEQMIAITVIAVASLASVPAGVLALVRAGIAREGSDNSLRSEPATLAAALTRCIVGLYVCLPENVTQADLTTDR